MGREGSLEVENPTETLLSEDGIFKVISPSGYVFRVTCRKGRTVQGREIGAEENGAFPEVAHHDRFDGSACEISGGRWQIEKIE